MRAPDRGALVRRPESCQDARGVVTGEGRSCDPLQSTRYNLLMRFTAALVVLVVLITNTAVLSQNAASSEPKSATVPITIDQGRVVIDVAIPLSDGTTESGRGWVDNGNPDLAMNRRVAGLMGLGVNCNGQI